MNFELTEDQKLFQDTVLKFAHGELAKDAVARAKSSDYPWVVAERMASVGLLGLTIPEAKGGLGGSLVDAILAIQAVAAACPRSADVVQAGNFGAVRTFAEYASEDQRKRFLHVAACGDSDVRRQPLDISLQRLADEIVVVS